jgi:chorismate mutase
MPFLAPPDPGRDRPATVQELEALRARLDGIDDALLDVVRRRIQCCRDIAAVKRRHGVPMMQPHRVGLVHRRAARYAADNGIDADFVRRLYELMIGETCRVESQVIAEDEPAA